MSSSLRSLAYSFTQEELTAPASRGTARLMPTTVKSGHAASLRRGVAHMVRSAAIATDGDKAQMVAIWQCGGTSINAAPVVDTLAVVTCSRCAEASRLPRGPVVYRCFADDDEVIYIGSTIDLVTRLQAHRTGTYWWDEVARLETEPHDTERAVRLAEANAIATERPFYNRDGNPERWGTRHTRRLA